ncbi:hypothetical protein [Methylobacter sp.]|uniref:hypothetical protein n=1 Tax=Methylobacter sp. TaxID=2051955 RepID=UPI002FDEC189
MKQHTNGKLRAQPLPIAKSSRPEPMHNPLPVREWMHRLTLCLCLLAPGLSIADDSAPALTLHYFGTAGLSYVTSGQADFVRNLSQPNGPKGGQWSGQLDSLVGAQANFQVNEQLEIVAQAVSQHRYDDTYIPELTWAFARYLPRPDIELRGGRLGMDFYMRADSRLVGYSYLTVRPSVDYYGGLPFQYLDGLDGAVTLVVGEGLLRAKVFGGYSPEKIPFAEAQWDLSDSPMLGGNLGYQLGSWQFRLSYAQIRYTHNLPLDYAALMTTLRGIPLPGTQLAADALTIQGTTSRHYSAGVIYDEGPLQVQLMVSGAKHESAFFQDGVAGYLLTGYRVGDITPYAGLSWSRNNPATVHSTGIPALDAAVTGAIDETHSDQHTYTLGLRWDLYSGMDVKVQWDAVRGSPGSKFLYRWEQPGWTGQTHVLSAVVDFAF